MSIHASAQATTRVATKKLTRDEVLSALRTVLAWNGAVGSRQASPTDVERYAAASATIMACTEAAKKTFASDPAYIAGALVYASARNSFPSDNADFLDGCANYYKAHGYLTPKQVASLSDSRLVDCLGMGEDFINAAFDIESDVIGIRKKMKKAKEKAEAKAAKLEIAVGEASEDSFRIGHDRPKDQAAKVIDLLVKNNAACPTLFRMGDKLVKLSLHPDTKQASTTVLDWKGMQQEIEEHTTWYRINPASDENPRDYKATPQIVAETVLAKIGPRLSRLDMIVGTPFFDSNGNLVATPGFHEQAHVYYSPTHALNATLPPDDPTPDDVARALAVVMEPFEEFPFDDPAAKAHTLAMLFQPTVRPMIDGACPPFIITKPALPSGSRTGGTLLAQVVHNICYGCDAGTDTVPDSEREWKSTFVTKLLEGTAMILFDNVPTKYTLNAGTLNAFATGATINMRILNGNTSVNQENTGMLVFTGNAVKTNEEMKKRSLFIYLDTHLADSSQGRTFKRKPLTSWVRRNRSDIVSALLVLVRSWIAAGMPHPRHGREHAGYETFSYVIGGILDHVGVDGFLMDHAVKNRSVASESSAITDFVKLWHDRHGLDPVKVSTLVDILTVHRDSLGFRWLSEDPSKWNGKLGSELSDALTAKFDVGDGVTVGIEKLPRGSDGQRYRLVKDVRP